MERCHQLVFAVSLTAICWFMMMAVHELGHVVGAVATNGSVERVVLHPFTISRTDVSPNPQPAIVVWLGPVVGCVLPLVVFALIPRRFSVTRSISRFFAGFCLIANGAYISLGSFDRVGDCGEMLRTGTPQWVLFVFGAVTASFGLYLWHGLGSPKRFLESPREVTPQMAHVAVIVLVAMMSASLLMSPR